MHSRLLAACVLGIALLTVCGSAMAHHGTPAYEDKITEVKNATVTRFGWSNPHSIIDLDVKNKDGKIDHWVVETAAPQALRLIGWEKDSLKPGDVVTFRVYAAKNGNTVGRLNKIIMADGSELHDTVLGGDAGGKAGYRPEDYATDSGKK